MVLSWRNDESVKKWLISKQNVTWEEHIAFIELLRVSDSVFYWLAIQNGVSTGVVSLKVNQTNRTIGTAGIFLDPSLIGSGIGIELAYESVHIYYEKCGIKTLINDVYKKNKAAVRLNRLMGYEFQDNPSDPELYRIVMGLEQFLAIPKDFGTFWEQSS